MKMKIAKLFRVILWIVCVVGVVILAYIVYVTYTGNGLIFEPYNYTKYLKEIG